MSHHESAHEQMNRNQTTGRRRELRELLLAAADTAREGRRRCRMARAIQPVGRAVRDRVSMLLSAAA